MSEAEEADPRVILAECQDKLDDLVTLDNSTKNFLKATWVSSIGPSRGDARVLKMFRHVGYNLVSCQHSIKSTGT